MTHPITITLPIPKGYSPNARQHHFAKANAAAKLKKFAYEAATIWFVSNAEPPPQWPHGQLIVTWISTRPNWVPDYDNASARLKPYLDGLVDAGVYIDDRNVPIVIADRLVGKVGQVVIVCSPDLPANVNPARDGSHVTPVECGEGRNQP